MTHIDKTYQVSAQQSDYRSSKFSVKPFYDKITKHCFCQADFDTLAVIGRGAFGEVKSAILSANLPCKN